VTTLEGHLDGGRGPDAAALGALVAAMAAAGVRIADELARTALIGQLETTGHTNVQGEEVEKLDVWANDVVVAALDATGRTCTLVSEGMGKVRHSLERCAGSRFVVCVDPVDGSSNLDVNGIVGSIFSVSRKARTLLEGASTSIRTMRRGTGKLRLPYECPPNGLIIEQAGESLHRTGSHPGPGPDLAAPAGAAADR
jgi:fructose-1,6-bisphosphatase I